MKRLLAACVGTRIHDKVLAWIDGPLEHYKGIDWPYNWMVIWVETRLKLSDIYNRAFSLYPDESYYGFLSDDIIPETYQWDRKIKEAAGNWNVVYCHDGQCLNDLSALAMGGDLARALGYLFPPGFYHLYMDNVQTDIAEAMGLSVSLPHIMMRHAHFSFGLAPVDETYSRTVDGVDTATLDRRRYEEWKSLELSDTIRRLKEIRREGLR